MSGDVDDRKPLEYKVFVDLIYGKLVGDKGYISKNLFEKLFVDGINFKHLAVEHQFSYINLQDIRYLIEDLERRLCGIAAPFRQRYGRNSEFSRQPFCCSLLLDQNQL